MIHWVHYKTRMNWNIQILETVQQKILPSFPYNTRKDLRQFSKTENNFFFFWTTTMHTTHGLHPSNQTLIFFDLFVLFLSFSFLFGVLFSLILFGFILFIYFLQIKKNKTKNILCPNVYKTGRWFCFWSRSLLDGSIFCRCLTFLFLVASVFTYTTHCKLSFSCVLVLAQSLQEYLQAHIVFSHKHTLLL